MITGSIYTVTQAITVVVVERGEVTDWGLPVTGAMILGGRCSG
jgi:hypothetical protein